MNKIFLVTLKFLLISVVIYFGIAAGLILSDKPKKLAPDASGPAFEELFIGLHKPAPTENLCC